MASSFEIHARHHWSFQLVLMGSRLQLEGCRDGEEPLRCSTLAKSAALASQAEAVGECQLLISRMDGVEGGGLQSAAQGLVDQPVSYTHLRAHET